MTPIQTDPSMTLASSPLVLAQRGAPDSEATTSQEGSPSGDQGLGGSGNGAAPQQSPFGGQFMLLMVGVLLFFIVISIMSGRKQRKQRESMIGSLAKHDKVQTIGGVIGTVVDIRDKELVLRVDDSTDTRIRFSKSAVQQVLRQGKAGPESEPAEQSGIATQQ